MKAGYGPPSTSPSTTVTTLWFGLCCTLNRASSDRGRARSAVRTGLGLQSGCVSRTFHSMMHLSAVRARRSTTARNGQSESREGASSRTAGQRAERPLSTHRVALSRDQVSKWGVMLPTPFCASEVESPLRTSRRGQPRLRRQVSSARLGLPTAAAPARPPPWLALLGPSPSRSWPPGVS